MTSLGQRFRGLGYLPSGQGLEASGEWAQPRWAAAHFLQPRPALQRPRQPCGHSPAPTQPEGWGVQHPSLAPAASKQPGWSALWSVRSLGQGGGLAGDRGLCSVIPHPLPSWVGSWQRPGHCAGPGSWRAAWTTWGGDAFLSAGHVWGPGGVTRECSPHWRNHGNHGGGRSLGTLLIPGRGALGGQTGSLLSPSTPPSPHFSA